MFARYAVIPWSGGFMLPYGNFFVRSRFTVASAGARSAVLRFLGKPKRFLKEKDLGESALVVWGVVAARRGVDAARPPGVKSLGLPPASLRPLRARRGGLVVWGVGECWT